MRQNNTNDERTRVIKSFSARENAAARQNGATKGSEAVRPAVKKAKTSDNARQSAFSQERSLTDKLKKESLSKEKNEKAEPSREKETKKSKSHIPSPFTGLLLALIVVIGLVSFINTVAQGTKINEISIKTEDIGFNDKILQICEEVKGKSYMGLESTDIENSILSLSPLISECELSGKFPRGLNISIIYESPAYYTCTENYFYALSAELKVLSKAKIEETDLSSLEKSLTRLYLPDFNEQELGKNIEFSSGERYVFKLCEALAEYEELGKINSIELTNTQNISFIFEDRFRCDLGASDDIDVKLTAAKNIFKNKLQNIINSDRTAVINVSNPSSASVRTDVPLGND